MTILVCGGGSGGHITPLLAVAHELKRRNSQVKVVYVGEKTSKFHNLVEDSSVIDECHYIDAGKFRRYHTDSFLRKLFDVRTLLLNTRDLFRFLRGRMQSRRLLRHIKPDVVFIKGGFVGVPVGLAAARQGIPVVTHDSDTTPGLANRILAKHAALHTTGMPAEFYDYPADKTLYVGIPIAGGFEAAQKVAVNDAKARLNVPADSKVLLITGGSLGARNLNKVVISQYQTLFGLDEKLYIIHQTGQDESSGYEHERLRTYKFIEDMPLVMRISDLIIARASATTLAELGFMAKAAVVVPAAFLAGGHQVENGEYLAKHQAARVLHEAELQKSPQQLTEVINTLLANEQERSLLAQNLNKLIKTDAAEELANALLRIGSTSSS